MIAAAVRLCSVQIEHGYFKYYIRNKGLDPFLTRFAINKEKKPVVAMIQNT